MNQLLKGIKVLDLTNNIAGPAATASMADFGAEVIHIEKPVFGDDSRGFLPFKDGVSLSYCANNRGKKSVVLNIKDPASVEILGRMVQDSDVLIESFRPGVMDRLGLGYENMKKRNPRLIYCSISAFGHTGPKSHQAGYDLIAQAYSGFMHMTGEKNGPPMMSGVAIGDAISALNAFGCIMAALFYRQKSGQGQYIDVSLCRTMLWANLNFDYINSGKDTVRSGLHNPNLTPYGLFPGKDGTIAIACVNENLWGKLCQVMERPELANDAWTKGLAARVENQDFVNTVIGDWVRSFDSIEPVIALLEESGIPCSRVNNHKDLLCDPHARNCGWILEVPAGNGLGDTNYVTRGVLADFSATPGDARHPAPALGEHNFDVLQQYGLGSEEITQLEKRWAEETQ